MFALYPSAGGSAREALLVLLTEPRNRQVVLVPLSPGGEKLLRTLPSFSLYNKTAAICEPNGIWVV